MADGTAGKTSKDQPDHGARLQGSSVAPSGLPRVSVLLSTYNGASYLRSQLESLAAQEGVSVHLHARDDGSTDETCAIFLRHHAEFWPELRGLTSGPNLGAAASFMQLLRTAPDADYYAFCDQDDIWLSDKLARAVAALAGEEGPALYCSNMTLVAEDLSVLGVPPPHKDLRFQHLLFENFATGCTIVMNPAARDLINSRPPKADAIIMHDWWCALIIAAMGRVHYDPQPGILYRQHGGNVVGFDAKWGSQTAKKLSRLLRERHSFYPIHAQAAELLRLFTSDLPPHHRVSLERLVASKGSWPRRVAYALSGQIARQRLLDAAVVRGLILASWY